jgi:hypothetical protein
MPVKRIRAALRSWIYRKSCHAEQQEILMLLDRVVQNSQGVLLQLEAACDAIPQDSPAKCHLNAVLKRAEALLDQLRDQADVRRQRARARCGLASHEYTNHRPGGR